MKYDTVSAILLGSLLRILDNRDFYYRSVIGINYSHLTEKGKEAVSDLLEVVIPQIELARKAELDEYAKTKVWDTLKETPK